jgi:hypothetical protein
MTEGGIAVGLNLAIKQRPRTGRAHRAALIPLDRVLADGSDHPDLALCFGEQFRRPAPSAACAAASRATGTRYGRARHVIQPDLLAERDRGRVAAMLAADAELQVRVSSAGLSRRRCAPSRRRPRRRSKRTGPSAGCPARRNSGRNFPASSRDRPNTVCVRSLVPKLKKSATSAILSASSAARGSSIIVPTV